MGDKPPPYFPTPNSPSAPPAYLQSASDHDQTKGIDWSLNSPRSPNVSHTRHHAAPSAPSYSDVRGGSSSKGVDWSLNRPTASSHLDHPIYPGPSSTPPIYPGSVHPHHTTQNVGKVRGVYPPAPFHTSPVPPEPANPYTRWKTEFSRHYPGSTLSRETPSLMKLEVPKNRAFPVIGHATCPDCFDHGPHQPNQVKKKDGVLSSKKLPGQKCRRCSKIVYFVQSDKEVVEDRLPRDKPPPYTNRPSQIAFQTRLLEDFGHGWGSSEEGHGWNPGEGDGHGWGY